MKIYQKNLPLRDGNGRRFEIYYDFQNLYLVYDCDGA